MIHVHEPLYYAFGALHFIELIIPDVTVASLLEILLSVLILHLCFD
jgi:hypothetical protein